ncbi:MAG TPA: phosphate ABC transporter permease subunit PstC [Gaiellaceae bacterium]|nr:phosphate ABC transporter permease subunit PstC [Gaiellaceae bacterium]
MSTLPATTELRGRRRLRDSIGDRLLVGVTLGASVVAVVVLGLIAWKVLRGAHLAFSKFGLSFLTESAWDAQKGVFGALPGIYGTAVSSLIALVLATPLALAIALFLSELAPRGVRVVVGSLVETLAAVPSVVLGLWGILVLGPFTADHLEPWLNRWFGWLQIFSGEPSSSGILVAGLILTIMIVPIIASICRELFLAVPSELEEGALALGATRWEMVRGVILSSSRPGIAAAMILGLGRALGEAIAVAQVIGANWGIPTSLFKPGDTLASKIVEEFQGYSTFLQLSSLFYLGVILLAIGLVTNLAAQLIVRRFDVYRTEAR